MRRLDFAEGSALEDEATPMWRYVLLVVLAVGGVAFFVWRWRQRQADLAATSVENTPVRAKTTRAVAPVAARSHRPRMGSFIRKANTAKITVGTMNTKNGARQPNE